MLAASKQVNLPVFTGKLHVTQVNCARDLFTCELHVKLPAFAGNFARASFTVKTESNEFETFQWLCRNKSNTKQNNMFLLSARPIPFLLSSFSSRSHKLNEPVTTAREKKVPKTFLLYLRL